MQFRITPHSAVAPPADAIERLWGRLDERWESLSFARAGGEIEVRFDEDAPVSMTRDEREEIGRRAILAALTDICDGASELSSDWYAVSPEL